MTPFHRLPFLIKRERQPVTAAGAPGDWEHFPANRCFHRVAAQPDSCVTVTLACAQTCSLVGWWKTEMFRVYCDCEKMGWWNLQPWNYIFAMERESLFFKFHFILGYTRVAFQITPNFIKTRLIWTSSDWFSASVGLFFVRSWSTWLFLLGYRCAWSWKRFFSGSFFQECCQTGHGCSDCQLPHKAEKAGEGAGED